MMWTTVFNPVLLLGSFMLLSMTTNGGEHCVKPGSPYNGHYNPLKPQYSISETVEYSCNLDTHSVVGQSMRRCLSNETWDNHIPTCEVNLALGKSVVGATGEVVDNRKDTFYNILQSGTISVDLGQEFDISYVTLVLKPNTSYSLMIAVNNGPRTKLFCKVIRDQLLDLADNTFICNKGSRPLGLRGRHVEITNLSHSTTYSIYEIGVYSATDEKKCGDLDVPSHGNVNRYGDEARYVCDESYVLQGRPSSWCTEGHWNPTGQYCVHQPKDWVACGEPGTPINGYRYIGGKLQNESTYACNKGAVLAGHPKRTCLPNGTWSPQQIPKCVTNSALRKLGEPILLDTVKITVQPTTTISVTIFVTNDTTTVTQLQSPNTTHLKHFCKIDNVTSARELECNNRVVASLVVINLNDTANICDVIVYNSNEITTCGQPDQPLHGRIKFQNSTTTTFECDHGRKLSGSPAIYCVDGTWHPMSPQCTTGTSTPRQTWDVTMHIMGIALGATSAILVSFILYYFIRKYLKSQNLVSQLHHSEGATASTSHFNEPGRIPQTEQDRCRIRYPDVNTLLYDDISGQLIDLNEQNHYLELLNYPHYEYVINHGQVQTSNDNMTRAPSVNIYERVSYSQEEPRNTQGCQTTNYTNEL